MRLKCSFFYALIYFVGVIQGQEDDDEELNLDPDYVTSRLDLFFTSSATKGSSGYSNPGAHTISERDVSSASDRAYAKFGEFPWAVVILRRSNDEIWNRTNIAGGGSLIHPSVVMTVGLFSRYKADKMKIRAGEHVINSKDELYEHQDKNVNKIVVHPDYNETSRSNAIALLFLETPVTINRETPHIGIGCLAPRLPPPGTICYAMGWGAEDFAHKKVYAAMLKKVKLPLVDKTACEKNLTKALFGKTTSLPESVFCAGGKEGVDTCTGDGGGSLVCPLDAKESRFAIYGIIAFGVGCGLKDTPGKYVNVPYLYDWVRQQLILEDLNTNFYTIDGSSSDLFMF